MSSSFNKTINRNSNKNVINRAISNLVTIIPPRSIFPELNSKGLHVRVERENRCLVLTIKYRNFYIIHLSRKDGKLKSDIQKKKEKVCCTCKVACWSNLVFFVVVFLVFLFVCCLFVFLGCVCLYVIFFVLTPSLPSAVAIACNSSLLIIYGVYHTSMPY